MLVFRRALLCLLVAAVAGCDSGTDPVPPPASVELVSGSAQTGVVASALAAPPTVRVLTASGGPAARVTVVFQATDGSISSASAATDGNGVARSGSWTLGTRAGTQTVTATVAGLPPVTFTATALAGAATRMAAVAGTTQTGMVGSAAATAPVVRVADAYDNPVAGFTVNFAIGSGNGSIANATALTAADGTATGGAWVLGSVVGPHSVVATAPTLSSSSVTFLASAAAGDPAQFTMVTNPPATAVNGAVLSTQPVVQVADQFGNRVARAGIVVSVTAGNARVTNNQATTDASGVAAFSGLTLGGTAGAYQIRFSAIGLAPSIATVATNLTAGSPTRLAVLTAPPATVTSGVAFTSQPVIEVHDLDSNRVSTGSFRVTATLAGAGALSGTTSVDAVSGRATFTNLAYTGAGPFRLSFGTTGLETVATSDIAVGAVAGGCTGPRAIVLDYAIGQMTRHTSASTTAPNCLQFDRARNLGQQYLVMVENMPTTGGYNTGIFPGSSQGNSSFNFTLAGGGTVGSTALQPARSVAPELPDGMTHAWDFGQGPLYEFHPEEPAGGVPQPVIIRGANRIGINSANAAPVPGDTVIVFLAGVPRLGIPTGNQRAVVRVVSNELIIAEDVRLSTLRRADGNFNSPIADNDALEIAQIYAQQPKAQGDALFGGRHNAATEAEGGRVVAVHTLMPEAGVWGYTYSSVNVFAWDYWVGSNGSPPKTLAQHALRNAQVLFMHEVTHMRHWGMLERAGRTSARGNQWLVEGFARFTERLPIASYLLAQADPSRTGNVTLQRFSEFNNAYYRDDVPTFLSVGAAMLEGYASSSFVFDYFADQVAERGGNWRSALASFVTAAGSESGLNAVISTHLPGLTFPELFTRARIALYTDDLPGPVLPSWTQYLQYNLRASRPVGSATNIEPRNLWARVVPGSNFSDVRSVSIGSAWGYLIDGSETSTSASMTMSFGDAQSGVVSITRIR